MEKPRFLPQIALLGAALIWGLSFVVIKHALDVFPPMYLLAIRFTGAAAVLALIFGKQLKKIDKGLLINAGLAGVCLFAAYATQTFGITETTPGKNAFLTAIYCVIVPFLFWMAGGERPSFWNISAALLCLLGIGLVSLSQGLRIGRGDFLTIVGGFLYAVHIVVLSRRCGKYDSSLVTIVQFVSAGICAWIAGGLTETFPAAVAFSGESLWGLAYLTLLASAAAILFQTYGQKHASPSSASILLSQEAVFGVACSTLLYGEVLTPRLVLGFAVIFAAVITSETKWSFLRPRKKAQSGADA
ncbi:MAG: DMT family transporter [Christensenellales bacterium]|jgi:drug/metabolite transporter (DMT)-like permease